MSRDVLVVVSAWEATNLLDLIEQFAALVEEPDDRDPAVARLTPDPYPDDAEASAQFRDVAQSELLRRRAADARTVLSGLRAVAPPASADPDAFVELTLDDDAVRAWMRTLAAVRLVLASRLGIVSEEDHDAEDPRFGVYDWIGYRLDALIHAAETHQGSENT